MTDTKNDPALFPLAIVCATYRIITGEAAPFSYRELLAACCDGVVDGVRKGGKWSISEDKIPLIPAQLRAAAERRRRRQRQVEAMETVA